MMGWKKMLGAAVLGIACSQAWAGTISVTATPGTVAPASQVSVAVNVADVAGLAAYNFSLSYDATVLKFLGYVAGSFLGSAGADTDQGFIGNDPGLISFAYGTIVGDFSTVSGAGTLGYFNFEALTVGMSALSLSDVMLSDADYNELSTSIENGSVTVAAAADVPEPSSWMLLAGGAIAAAVLRRRRRMPA